MKNQIIVVLALAALNSLSGCSGSVPNSAAYPGYAAQQMAYSQNNLPNTQQLGQQPNPTSNPVISPETSQTRASNSTATIQQNTTGSKAAPVKSAATKPATSVKGAPLAMPAKAAAPQVSVAQQLVTKAVARFNSLDSFKFMVDGFEMVSGKTPSRLSFNMFALKGQAKIEVLKHTNSLYVGVKMGYQAGKDAISVRPGGALGFVKVDTKMNDERLSTPRGYRLDQIDAFAIAKRLLSGPQQPKVLGKTQINGRTIAILEYTNANSFDQRITRELLGIDMEDHFIRMHEMFEGDKLVFSLKLNNIQLNAPVSEAEIKI
jgi:hypothetical protein